MIRNWFVLRDSPQLTDSEVVIGRVLLPLKPVLPKLANFFVTFWGCYLFIASGLKLPLLCIYWRGLSEPYNELNVECMLRVIVFVLRVTILFCNILDGILDSGGTIV